jgi:hyaluronan synthase
MFPNELRAFFKQRVRWSRNSYRCYLTSIAKGWLWRQPFITQVTVLQILLTPFSMATALVVIVVALPVKTWVLLSMNTHGWLTRKSDRLGGEGQDQASLAS